MEMLESLADRPSAVHFSLLELLPVQELFHQATLFPNHFQRSEFLFFCEYTTVEGVRGRNKSLLESELVVFFGDVVVLVWFHESPECSFDYLA